MLTQRERIKNESAFSALSSTPQQEDSIPPLWYSAVCTLKGCEKAKRVVSRRDRGMLAP